MSLADALDELRTRIEGNLPPGTVATLRSATAELEASGIDERVLRPGDPAPAFELEDQAGARLVAISPEKPEYSREIARIQRLELDVRHDPRDEAAASFGLRHQLTGDLRALYRDPLSADLPLYHGHTDWTLPILARPLVDAGGTLRYAESSPDDTRRPEPSAMLDVLATL